jgi:protein phosphatase 2C-like protein
MEPWRVAFASAIGTSHQAIGTACQDASGCEVLQVNDNTILIAVVSDGAGSAEHSDVGSERAVSAVTNSIRSYFLDEGGSFAQLTRADAIRWLQTVQSVLEAEAGEHGHDTKEYACTLLVAIVGTGSAAFMQIGDGAIVVSQGAEDGFSYVFWPQHGEFANTTNFVISPDAEYALEFEVAPRRIVELAIFSDGLENLLLHHATKTVHEAFFKGIFEPLRNGADVSDTDRLSADLASYLMSPKICGRTDDDKSLILATRALPPEPPRTDAS